MDANRILIGPSIAICEICLVRCQGWYEDSQSGRTRLTLCPQCGNGDPQLIADDYTDDNLDINIRLLLYLMKGDETDASMG